MVNPQTCQTIHHKPPLIPYSRPRPQGGHMQLKHKINLTFFVLIMWQIMYWFMPPEPGETVERDLWGFAVYLTITLYGVMKLSQWIKQESEEFRGRPRRKRMG